MPGTLLIALHIFSHLIVPKPHDFNPIFWMKKLRHRMIKLSKLLGSGARIQKMGESESRTHVVKHPLMLPPNYRKSET